MSGERYRLTWASSFVITDQDYPCQHIDHTWTTKNTGKYDSIGDKKKKEKHVYA
jgi:hypothetical protein